MEPLISVIVPVFNAGLYLSNCLDSIMNQTEQRLEIILIDDGSDDSSREIIEKYVRTCPLVVGLYLRHQGVSKARNRGLQAARGKYIAFCDSDDCMEKTMLASLVEEIEQKDADLCCCGYQCCYSLTDAPGMKPRVGAVRVLEADDMYRYVRNDGGGYVWNKLFRRTLLETGTPLRFHEDIAVLEDELFVYEYLERCRRICVTDTKLYRYLQHEQSALHQKFSVASMTQMLARERIYTLVEIHTTDQQLKQGIWNDLIRTYSICYKKLLTISRKDGTEWRKKIRAGFHKLRGQYRLNSSWSLKEKLYYLLLYVLALK